MGPDVECALREGLSTDVEVRFATSLSPDLLVGADRDARTTLCGGYASWGWVVPRALADGQPRARGTTTRSRRSRCPAGAGSGHPGRRRVPRRVTACGSRGLAWRHRCLSARATCLRRLDRGRASDQGSLDRLRAPVASGGARETAHRARHDPVVPTALAIPASRAACRPGSHRSVRPQPVSRRQPGRQTDHDHPRTGHDRYRSDPVNDHRVAARATSPRPRVRVMTCSVGAVTLMHRNFCVLVREP